jgi:cytochrome c553
MTGRERFIKSTIVDSVTSAGGLSCRRRIRAVLPGIVAAMALAVAAPSRAANVEAGKSSAEPCAACHGPQGVSEMEGVPSLAAQPDQFTQWQLVYFRGGTRKNEIMEPLAAEISDADIRNLGAYFAALPPPPAPSGLDDKPALTEQGAKLAAQRNCGTCHLDNYAGQKAIARLAGQREEYLVKSLGDFRASARTGSGVAAMADAAYGLSDDEIAALSHYIARVR